MIEDDEIGTALGGRLQQNLNPSLPIAWPGDDLPPATARPYLIFEMVPVDRTDGTLRGGGEIVKGYIQITVMSEPGLPIWSDSVRNGAGNIVQSCGAIAKTIRALYPYTLRLPVTGGEITITKPPQVMQGYPDGPHWRTPVKITYEAS